MFTQGARGLGNFKSWTTKGHLISKWLYKFINLELQKAHLVSKWLYKFMNEEGVWHELLKKKHLENKTTIEDFWKPKTHISSLALWRSRPIPWFYLLLIFYNVSDVRF